MCKVTENQLKINNDRGTPLVCNDKLVGLLSVIIPPKNSTNSTQSVCDSNLVTSAYYVRVAQYNSWIHSVIGVNLPATIDGRPQPVIPSSPPFHGTIAEWKLRTDIKYGLTIEFSLHRTNNNAATSEGHGNNYGLINAVGNRCGSHMANDDQLLLTGLS